MAARGLLALRLLQPLCSAPFSPKVSQPQSTHTTSFPSVNPLLQNANELNSSTTTDPSGRTDVARTQYFIDALFTGRWKAGKENPTHEESATSTTAARDYYKILQIRPNASPEEVKQAFHALSKKYHPDVAGSNPQSHTKFIEISEAFSVLGKEQSRREYDLQRRLNAFSASAEGYKMTYPKVDLSIDPQVLKSYDMEMHRRWSSRLEEWARDQGEYELERGIHMTPVSTEISVSYLSMEESRHFTYMLAGFTAFLAAITYLYVQVKIGKRTTTTGG